MTAGAQFIPRLGVVLLAAGQGRRMGGPNKLLADLNGVPVVRRSAEPLTAALPQAPKVAVTGRDGDRVAAALAGTGFRIAHNPTHGEGMAGSLAVGLTALPPDLDGVVIALGDMPGLRVATLTALVDAFAAHPAPGRAVIRPVFDGCPGNPVLWGAAWRTALSALTGDRGGRDLLASDDAPVVHVPLSDPAIRRDIDTPADLDAARQTPADAGTGWSRTGPAS